ncbi:MAG: hypothetical protein MUC97_14590 [Bernardetiaceae bacterium]|jgi:hypothetical protein|nr:hypothetical protein [Bernardetiaceae bacterium]
MWPKLIAIAVFLQTVGTGRGLHRWANPPGARARYQVRALARLPARVRECSGLAVWRGPTGPDSLSLIAHGDGGTGPLLYRVSLGGHPLDSLRLPAPNVDWEDLAQDGRGHLYIGDFGNNGNARRQLTIYKALIDSAFNLKKLDTIRFRYPDQVAFPPPKNERNFDCEGLYWQAGHLHLVSKNRGRGPAKHYRLPDQPGQYVAELLPSGWPVRGQVTAADLAPGGQRLALLTYGKIYVAEAVATRQPPVALGCREVARMGQAEALVFINETDFIFANEGGKLFIAREKRRK